MSEFSRRVSMAREGVSCSLHEAAREGNCEVVRHILSTDAEALNGRDRLSRTPLHLAAWAGHADVVKVLCDASADVGAAAMDDMAAIHFASQKGHSEVIRILLASGAYVNVKNRKGMTALHFAVQGRKEDLTRFLITRGANLSTENRAGKTPIDLVRDESMHAVIKEAEFERNARRSKGSKEKPALNKKDLSAAKTDRDEDDVSGSIKTPEQQSTKPKSDADFTLTNRNSISGNVEPEGTTAFVVRDITSKVDEVGREVIEPKRKKAKVFLSHLSFDD